MTALEMVGAPVTSDTVNTLVVASGSRAQGSVLPQTDRQRKGKGGTMKKLLTVLLVILVLVTFLVAVLPVSARRQGGGYEGWTGAHVGQSAAARPAGPR